MSLLYFAINRHLQPDLLLFRLFFKSKESTDRVTFEELFASIFAKLPPMHQIKRVYGEHREREEVVSLRKGRFQPLEFKLESRGGNKKVTCVYHLGQFELDSSAIQAKIKKTLGCSVTLSEVSQAGAAADYVVCVQGNQVFPVSELLKSNF